MPSSGVVVGASMAGMLAAAALSRVVDEVTVLERDGLPDGPEPRKGLPQGRHAHLLLPSGRDAIEALVPGGGVRKRLLAAGARELALTSDLVSLGPEGWFRRWRHADHPLVVASRALMDFTVRDAVVGSTGVRVRRAEVVRLLGTARRVTGVRALVDGAEVDLRADLVVDASGRGSRIEHWLAELGVTGIPRDEVDSGLVYASRVYRVPRGAEDFPLTQVTADPFAARPGQAGLVMPIEGDRWLVSLAGTRGGEPSADPADFVRFALGLRHPIVGRLISGAEPLTDVMLTRSTRNTRLYLEKARRRPEGLVALGDAVATYNPVYGQGMTVAALGARALDRELDRGGVTAPDLARRAQRAVAKVVNAAWTMSTSQDQWFPGVRGRTPTPVDRLLAGYTRRMTRTATTSYRVSTAMCEVTTLQKDAVRLVGPKLLLATLAGPVLPPLAGPPLTTRERAVLNSLDGLGNTGST